MIPPEINREHVLRAISEVDEEGIPRDRHSIRWSVSHEDRFYPPKYLISIANRYTNGSEWPSENFSGGDETNNVLRSLGFEIVPQGTRQSGYPLKSHSWVIYSDTVAVKKMDKSAFLHHGTGVPRQFCFFFGVDDIAPDDRRDITLRYEGEDYQAHFQLHADLTRVRLFWKSDFEKVIQEQLPAWYSFFSQNQNPEKNDPPEFRFERARDGFDNYQVSFIDPLQIEQDVDSELIEETPPRTEGRARSYYGKRYERDSRNRKIAIGIHGTTCAVCRFNFAEVYGERGDGYIEIHHINPLSDLETEQIVNPQTDLVPVCSNCHRISIVEKMMC